MLQYKEPYRHELPVFHYVGGSVGSGKTYWAIKMMIENAQQNYIYVAPTTDLCQQIESRIANEDVDHTKVVHRIDSEDHEGTVVQDALHIIFTTRNNSNKILILTTNTFLHILDEYEYKHFWNVILDEAFNPLDITELSTDHLDIIFKYIDCSDPANICPVSRAKMDEVLDDRTDVVINDNPTLTSLFEKVRKSVETVELAFPEKVENVKEKIVFTSYINQEGLRPFNEVLFMQALFEETILYRLWVSQGIEFTEHEYFDGKLNSVHSSKGEFVSVGHLLHEDDNTSKNRFQKSYETGEQLGTPRDGTVIHELIRQAEHYLNDSYLLSFNKWVKCRKVDYYPSGKKIPPVANGLDNYRESHKIACLMSNNPEPLLTSWIENRTGMSVDEINNTYRNHSIYQSIGRTSIRDMDNTDPKIFIVASKKDAQYIHELFEGSKWLGQVGDMNKVPTPPRKQMVNSVKDNDVYQEMYRKKKVLQKKRGLWKKKGLDVSGIQDEITSIDEDLKTLKTEIKKKQG